MITKPSQSGQTVKASRSWEQDAVSRTRLGRWINEGTPAGRPELSETG